MKKNFNIIQIKGIRGIIYVAFIVCCLAAGFGWFPGWVCMKIWNVLAAKVIQIPTIGIIQGMLLWGIVAASYFTFRKEKLVVCMKASDELNEEELKSVFEDLKKQAKDDVFLKNMLNARKAELRIKNLSESNIPGVNIKDVSNPNNYNEPKEKIETK
jgi:polyhydroxyalkanoate synthesis regulator phasin